MVDDGLVIEGSRLTLSDYLRTGNHHLEYLCRCVYGVVVSQMSVWLVLFVRLLFSGKHHPVSRFMYIL